MDAQGVIRSLFGVPRALVGVVVAVAFRAPRLATGASTRSSGPLLPKRAYTRQPAFTV
jgi:hypothetical protein